MNEIREMRRSRRLSQTAVGNAVGRSQVWISLVERGKVAPDAETMRKIKEAITRLAEFRSTLKREAKLSIETEMRELFKDLRLS